MNGRRLFRLYAQSKGKEAISFVKIKKDYYWDTLVTKDSDGREERTDLGYDDMVNWIIASKKIKVTEK